MWVGGFYTGAIQKSNPVRIGAWKNVKLWIKRKKKRKLLTKYCRDIHRKIISTHFETISIDCAQSDSLCMLFRKYKFFHGWNLLFKNQWLSIASTQRQNQKRSSLCRNGNEPSSVFAYWIFYLFNIFFYHLQLSAFWKRTYKLTFSPWLCFYVAVKNCLWLTSEKFTDCRSIDRKFAFWHERFWQLFGENIKSWRCQKQSQLVVEKGKMSKIRRVWG